MVKQVMMIFRCDPETREKLRERAAQERRSMNAHMEHLIEMDYLSGGTVRIQVYKTITPETLEKAD